VDYFPGRLNSLNKIKKERHEFQVMKIFMFPPLEDFSRILKVYIFMEAGRSDIGNTEILIKTSSL
jgi:hypothetical protein